MFTLWSICNNSIVLPKHSPSMHGDRNSQLQKIKLNSKLYMCIWIFRICLLAFHLIWSRQNKNILMRFYYQNAKRKWESSWRWAGAPKHKWKERVVMVLEQGGGSCIKSLNIGSNPCIQYKTTIRQKFSVADSITIINYRKNIAGNKWIILIYLQWILIYNSLR